MCERRGQGDDLSSQNMNNNHYNKTLKPFAVNLRNNSTNAEIKLWVGLLKNKQLLDYSFLRQRPIGNYIADFFCKELKLIIEVDGSSHVMKEAADMQRDLELKRMGYTTLRFSNEEVIYNIGNVRELIVEWIKVR